MGRKPKSAAETPEQFILPHMPKSEIKDPTPLESAIQKTRRNLETGLLENLEYKFLEDGKIDWLSMLPPETLYLNKDKFPEGTNLFDLDISEQPNDKKIMKLDAILWILEKGGAISVKFKIGSAYPEYAASSCEIEWPKSYLYPHGIITGGNGEAHSFNNVPPFKYLLATLAENKSLSRAVRKFANINSIYSADELRGEKGDKPENEDNVFEISGSMPQNALESIAQNSKTIKDGAKKRGCSIFEFVKLGLIQTAEKPEEKEIFEKLESFKDVPRNICYDLIMRIKKKDEKPLENKEI